MWIAASPFHWTAMNVAVTIAQLLTQCECWHPKLFFFFHVVWTKVGKMPLFFGQFSFKANYLTLPISQPISSVVYKCSRNTKSLKVKLILSPVARVSWASRFSGSLQFSHPFVLLLRFSSALFSQKFRFQQNTVVGKIENNCFVLLRMCIDSNAFYA